MTTLELDPTTSYLTINAEGCFEIYLAVPENMDDEEPAPRGLVLATAIALETKRLSHLPDADLEALVSEKATRYQEAQALIDSAQKHLAEGLSQLQQAFGALKR